MEQTIIHLRSAHIEVRPILDDYYVISLLHDFQMISRSVKRF